MWSTGLIILASIPFVFQNNVRDKLTPIVVDFTFELVEKTRNKRDVTPVLNQRTPTTASAEVNT